MIDLISPSSFWSRTWLQLAAVFVVAFVLRAFFVLHYGPILTNDSTYYLSVAEGIQQGKGLGLPYRSPPLYPLFLALIHSVCSSHWAIIWVQAVVGALTCVVLAATCRRLFQPKLAFVLGLAATWYIPMAAFCVTVLRETIIGFGISLATYCLVRSLQEQGIRWCWITGAAGAFTLFNQATFVFFPFWVGIAYWIHARSFKSALRRILPVIVCYAIAVGSWTARNYHVTGRVIPLSADHIGYFLLEGIMDANKEAKALTPEQIRFLGIAEDDPYNTYAGMRDQYWGLGEAEGTGGLERKLKDGPVLFSRAVRLALHEPGRYLRF
jgi:4-amino-4-deoxy-L-arabinose transferase-like glycosyltransferase